MRVLRLEVDGMGVFSADAVENAIGIAVRKRGEGFWPELQDFDGPLSPYRHPCPRQDVPGWAPLYDRHNGEASKFFCGFASREKMLAWFDSEAVRIAMNEIGVELIEFEVPDEHVMIGGAQVMFRKNKAQEIGRGPVPTLVH